MDNFKELPSLKEMVIYRLKEMIDRVEVKDKCTICETIHILEQPDDNRWSNNSLWTLLIFLIFFGFGNDVNLFDLEIISKVLNESITNSKESEKEELK